MPLRGGYDRYSTLDYMEHGLLWTSYISIVERSVFLVAPLEIFRISVQDNAKTLSLICLPLIRRDKDNIFFVVEAFVLW